MPSIHETAYPRLKSSFSEKELKEIFTPTPEEFDLAHSIAKSTPLKIVFLVLLKTFQRLGYFLPLHKAPRQIAEHISLIYGVHYGAMEWEAYDASGSRYRFIARIREYLRIRHFDATAQQILSTAIEQAALLRDDLADKSKSAWIHFVTPRRRRETLVRLWQIGLNPGTGRYENSSQFAAALRTSW
jgi:hypothetical protein